MGFFTRANPASVPTNGQKDSTVVTVTRVDPKHRRVAIGCLIGTDATDPAVDTFLMQANHEGVDLTLMWMAVPTAESPATFGQVALLIPAPGRTAVVLVSGADGPSPRSPELRMRLRAAAIEACCDFASTSTGGSLRLAQALIDPGVGELSEAYRAAGFVHLAELAYLRRERRALARVIEAHPSALSPDLRIVCYADLRDHERDAQLGCALEASYVGTLDCPILCGMRTTDDVIVSHKAVGAFDPRLWWLIFDAGVPAGCLLLSPVPQSGTIELVYLGVAPSLRGARPGAAVGGAAGTANAKGSVASVLLAHGLRELPPSSEDTLACAVDVANTPAMRFYSRWKLRRFATKSAFVRPLGQLSTP